MWSEMKPIGTITTASVPAAASALSASLTSGSSHGWLGGPDDYVQNHGHPRLRMRHAHVPVTQVMRDAWMHSMRLALRHDSIDADLASFLDEKLGEVADFMRNQPA